MNQEDKAFNQWNHLVVADTLKAVYFGVTFASTPQVSHTDQMHKVVRYIHIEDGEV